MSSIDNNQFKSFEAGAMNFEGDALRIKRGASSFEDKSNISFKVGKGGGSISQPFEDNETGRGLDLEQGDPLALWWVKLLKGEYSADGTTQKSYRRSRWGRTTTKKLPANSAFVAMHRQGRLLNNFLFATAIGLIASLNMVALAESHPAAVGETAASAHETPSAMRFSLMKDFVGQHNQYLDLSKLSDFKWADETRVATGPLNRKRQAESVFIPHPSESNTKPQVVRTKKQSIVKNDAELTGALRSDFDAAETGSDAASSVIPHAEATTNQ